MGLDISKVMVEVDGMPFIEHIVRAVHGSGVDLAPIIVISAQGHSISDHLARLGMDVRAVVQKQQLGTGHAVQCALPEIAPSVRSIIVLYGDHPFIRPATIRTLAETHAESGGVLSILTVRLPDFEEDRALYEQWGRIIRNSNGNIERIVEFKDASDEERAVTEVNPAIFCFDASWLRRHISTLTDDNAQQELYLTDLIEIAMRERQPIATTTLPAEEAIGVNTPEHLAVAERLYKQQFARQAT